MTTNSHHTFSLKSPFAAMEVGYPGGRCGSQVRQSNHYLENAMARRSEAGQALALTAGLLVVLMGFAGLAIDMGVMRYEKRLQQTAADAAAIAGASNLGFGGITSGAQDAASQVGFTDNGGGQVSNCVGAAVGTICVQVNNPPNSGPHQGDSTGNCPPAPSCYVEVLVAEVHPTYFMKILSINSETITARAVAANLGGAPGDGCLYTLAPPSAPNSGIDLNRRATLNASTCGIVDNGNFNDRGTVLADTFAVSGDPGGRRGRVTCITPSPCPTYNTPATSDPLGYLTPPPVQAPSFGTVMTMPTQTLQPGTYTSITISSGSNVTFAPGIYYINGAGLSFQGSATVQGTGVTLYFTNGASINTIGAGQASNIQLTAPTTGPYVGILMYQDPADTSTFAPTIGAQNGSFFDGALYFPADQVTFVGNGAGAAFNVGIVVADSVVLSSNPTVNVQGSAAMPAGVTLIKNATLVE